MSDTDAQSLFNILSRSLPARVEAHSNGDNEGGTVDVLVQVDSDMLCLAGYYNLPSLPVHEGSSSDRPVVMLAFLLNRLFSQFDGPASNGVAPGDILVKSSLRLSSQASSKPSSSAVADQLVPHTVHSGNPADYTVREYMDKIVAGATQHPYVTLRPATSDEIDRAGSPPGSRYIALWLHVNAQQAAKSNLASAEGDLSVDARAGNGDISTRRDSAPSRTTPASSSRFNFRPTGSQGAPGPFPSFSSLPPGTVAAAARASLAASTGPAEAAIQSPIETQTASNPNVKSQNGRIPSDSDEAEVGRAFGERVGLGNLWGKVGLGRRRAADVLAVIAPAIMVMRELNKKMFSFNGKQVKLTKRIMIQGLGIADKSFSPMETAFRRGQYLLNTVAEHDLEDETHAIDTIGEVFTNIHAETTVDELYNANDSAWKAVRAAATARGLADVADMMFTDWAMGRHTWKTTEPRPTYVGDIHVSPEMLLEDGEVLGAAEGDVTAGDDSVMVEADATGVDLLNELADGHVLPVDPELMGKGARKRGGGSLESAVSKRIA